MADHRSAAVILHMVRASLLVQHQVPVDPAVHAVVQVADDVMGVLLRVKHIPAGIFPEAGKLHAAFAVHQLQSGIVLPHHGKRLEMIPRIPVVGRALDHGFRSPVHDGAHALIDPLLIVIPDIDAHMAETVCLKGGIQVIPKEALLLLRRIFAGVPGLHGKRLVLYGHETDGDPGLFIFLQISDDVGRIGRIALRLQMAASVSYARLLHEGRRGPGRQKQADRLSGRGESLLHQGLHVARIPFQAEIPEIRIVRPADRAVISQRKIAAVHVHPAQGIAQAVRPVTGLHHPVKVFRAHAA